MPIQTACSSCNAPYNLADTQAGKTVRCRSCGDTFTVRDPAPPREERDEPPPVARFAPRDRTPPPPPPPRREDYDDRPRERPRDDYDDRPRRRERPASGGGGGLLIGALIGGGVLILLVMGGIVAAIVMVSSSAQRGMAQVNNPPPNFNNPPPNFPNRPIVPVRPGGMPNIGNPGGPAGFPGMPPANANWNNLRVGMTEAQVVAQFGEPAQRHDHEGIHVIHAKVTQEEVMGNNGQTRPVRKLLYFKGIGQPGFMHITLVDGKVYKFWE